MTLGVVRKIHTIVQDGSASPCQCYFYWRGVRSDPLMPNEKNPFAATNAQKPHCLESCGKASQSKFPGMLQICNVLDSHCQLVVERIRGAVIDRVASHQSTSGWVGNRDVTSVQCQVARGS